MYWIKFPINWKPVKIRNNLGNENNREKLNVFRRSQVIFSLIMYICKMLLKPFRKLTERYRLVIIFHTHFFLSCQIFQKTTL